MSESTISNTNKQNWSADHLGRDSQHGTKNWTISEGDSMISQINIQRPKELTDHLLLAPEIPRYRWEKPKKIDFFDIVPETKTSIFHENRSAFSMLMSKLETLDQKPGRRYSFGSKTLSQPVYFSEELQKLRSELQVHLSENILYARKLKNLKNGLSTKAAQIIDLEKNKQHGTTDFQIFDEVATAKTSEKFRDLKSKLGIEEDKTTILRKQVKDLQASLSNVQRGAKTSQRQHDVHGHCRNKLDLINR